MTETDNLMQLATAIYSWLKQGGMLLSSVIQNVASLFGFNIPQQIAAIIVMITTFVIAWKFFSTLGTALQILLVVVLLMSFTSLLPF